MRFMLVVIEAFVVSSGGRERERELSIYLFIYQSISLFISLSLLVSSYGNLSPIAPCKYEVERPAVSTCSLSAQ